MVKTVHLELSGASWLDFSLSLQVELGQEEARSKKAAGLKTRRFTLA